MPLINAIVNNALLHSNSHIKQMPPQIIHILRFCGRLAAPDFIMKCTEAMAVRCRPEVWKLVVVVVVVHLYSASRSASNALIVAEKIKVLQVSYIIAFSDWRSK